MKTYLFGHVDESTALKVDNYPWGFRLRTSIFYWIESEPKKGDRFVSMTIDPKTGRKCKPKKSTYHNIAVMYRNEENGHIEYNAVSIYSNADKREEFITAIGGTDKLNADQMTMLRQLRGEVIVKTNEFTGEKKKDFSVKWEKDSAGVLREVKITFDRPDGVKIKEIFKALRSLNQKRLDEVFAEIPSKWHASGVSSGFARICVRGGAQIGTVSANTYKEFLASDSLTKEETEDNLSLKEL